MAFVPRIAVKIPVFELKELTTSEPPVEFVKKRLVVEAVIAKRFVVDTLVPVPFVQSKSERLNELPRSIFVAKRLVKVALVPVRLEKKPFVVVEFVVVAFVKSAFVIWALVAVKFVAKKFVDVVFVPVAFIQTTSPKLPFQRSEGVPRL